MHNYLVCLKAMFRNKLRFGADKSRNGKIAFTVLLCVVYVFVMAALLGIIVLMKDILSVPVFTTLFYFFILLTAALIVLIFGVVHLVTTLYLSKDTDFYSMLPIKSVTVFAAKLSYVYIFETVLVALVMLPLMIAFGIVTGAGAAFYVVTLLTLVFVPALPLMLAALIAIPVMYIASKLKNRNIVALIFYLLLFGGVFGVYIYFISAGSVADITEDAVMRMLNGIETVFNIFYPYAALSYAACGIPTFGMSVGASAAINVLIFFAISAAFFVVIMLASKFMYARSVTANNQTDNSSVKNAGFKSSTGFKALVKREYISSFRTTQTAFQCYAVMLLPIIISVVFGIMFKNSFSAIAEASEAHIDPRFVILLGFSLLCAMFASLGNAAATTFSREGKAICSLKILPMGIGTILRAKLTAWLIITVPVAAVSTVIFGAMLFDLTYFLLAIFSLIPLSVALICFGALWDLVAPKLNWTDPIQAIKHNGHVTAGQMIALGAGLTVTVLVLVLSLTGVRFDIISALSWTLIYTELAIFTVVDILLYRRAENYYRRIEI